MLEAEKTMNVFKRYLQKPYLVVSDSKDLKTCPSAHTFSGYIYIYIYIYTLIHIYIYIYIYIYKLIQVAHATRFILNVASL